MVKPMSLTALSPPKFLLRPLISRKDWVMSALLPLFSQLPARNLPHVRLRKFTPEFDSGGNFIVGEILLAEAYNLLFGDFAPGFAFKHHIGLDETTHLRVGHSHDAGGLDLRMLEKHLFDLSGE